MDNTDIAFKVFYNLISRYLLENYLVDEVKFTESHLIAHEIASDTNYEFVLRVYRMDDKGGEKGKFKG